MRGAARGSASEVDTEQNKEREREKKKKKREERRKKKERKKACDTKLRELTDVFPDSATRQTPLCVFRSQNC